MLNFSTSKSQNFPFVFLLIPAMAISIFWLVKSNYFLQSPEQLVLPISIDLILTIPLVYFLLIRKRSVSKLTVIPVTVAAMIFGFLILPKEHHLYLDLFYQFVFPFIELGVISVFGYNAFKAVKAIKKRGKENPDMLKVIKETTGAMVINPKVKALLATEMSFIYYALFIYFRKNSNPAKKHSFSYHKENGMAGLMFVLIFILLAETFILHILLVKWSVVIAWVLTGISLYSLIFLIGHWNASRTRPITFSNNALNLKYGMFGDIDLPWDKIASIQYSGKDIEGEDTHVMTFLSGHNVIITLTEPQSFNGMYGSQKMVRTIAFFVDDQRNFESDVQLFREL